MPEPNSDHVNSTPNAPYQPYDAGMGGGTYAPWVKLDDRCGSLSLTTGRREGPDFPDYEPWPQV